MIAMSAERKKNLSYTSESGSSLCLGLRSLFGRITLPAFTVPTRSRAIARTSFLALNGFGFCTLFLATPLSRRLSVCHQRFRYAARELVERHHLV
jgi:hypothetical protein